MRGSPQDRVSPSNPLWLSASTAFLCHCVTLSKRVAVSCIHEHGFFRKQIPLSLQACL